MITSPITTFTSTTPFTLDVATSRAGAQAIAFYNESSYRLRVIYGGMQQSIPPWTGDLLSSLASWDGTLLVTPDVLLGAGVGACYYNLYGAGEIVPAAFPIALSRQQNLGSEPRVVSIEVIGGAIQQGALTVTGTGPINYASFNDLLNVSFAPRNIWASTLAFYLDAFTAILANGGGATYVEATLKMAQFDVSNTVLASTNVVEFALALTGAAGTSQATVPFKYPPPRIGFGFAPFNANVVRIAMQVFVNAFVGGAASLITNWSADIDFQSGGNIPPIGQGSGVLTGGLF